MFGDAEIFSNLGLEIKKSLERNPSLTLALQFLRFFLSLENKHFCMD